LCFIFILFTRIGGTISEMICETILNDSGYPKIYCTAGLLSSREPTKEGHLQLLHRAARWGESGSNLENYLSANRLAAAPTHEVRRFFFGSAIVCLGVLRSVEPGNTAIVKCSAIHHRVREKDLLRHQGVNCVSMLCLALNPTNSSLARPS